jgi:hypothetical protein
MYLRLRRTPARDQPACATDCSRFRPASVALPPPASGCFICRFLLSARLIQVMVPPSFMRSSAASFFVTGGTLRADAASYVERQADKDLVRWLASGEFCYLLTARQMGKSSLMVRAARTLRAQGHHAAVLDLASLGQQLTHEQWYDGLMVRLGQQLGVEDDLDAFWCAHDRFGPCQRFFAALRRVLLPRLVGSGGTAPGGTGETNPWQGKRLVVFVDELDVVRSLPFSTDEFFAAIRAVYNARTEDPLLDHLTFCLLGVATPAELMRDPYTTPFNLGQRIELHDFSRSEAAPMAARLINHRPGKGPDPERLLDRILSWTHGHPYLTQRLCQATAVTCARSDAETCSEALVDRLCHELFLGPRARETDDNLLYVRERLVRTESNLASLLDLYEQVLRGTVVPDDERNECIHQLRLAGVVRVESGRLVVRNQVYQQVFDQAWIHALKPVAELHISDSRRMRLRGTCTLGRTEGNDLILADPKVSRRHAVIHPQGPGELWVADLGSRNGTYLNGARISSPTLLRHLDQIDIGPYRMVFHQPNAPRDGGRGRTTIERTVIQ